MCLSLMLAGWLADHFEEMKRAMHRGDAVMTSCHSSSFSHEACSTHPRLPLSCLFLSLTPACARARACVNVLLGLLCRWFGWTQRQPRPDTGGGSMGSCPASSPSQSRARHASAPSRPRRPASAGGLSLRRTCLTALRTTCCVCMASSEHMMDIADCCPPPPPRARRPVPSCTTTKSAGQVTLQPDPSTTWMPPPIPVLS